jgi:hypothetical protein
VGGRAAVGQSVVGDQQQVDAGDQGEDGSLAEAVVPLDGAHAEVVADDDAVPAERAAQQAGDRRSRQRRRVAPVEPPVEHVGGHDGVHDVLGHQPPVGTQLHLGPRRVGDVDESQVRVREARAVTGEVLERRQQTGRAHPGQVRAGVRGDARGIGAEAAAGADDDPVGGVVADVDHRRQVPGDASLAQPSADPQRLQLGEREVAGVAEILMRECGRVAGRRAQAHDAPALGVDADEERPTRARPGPRGHPAREPRDLLGAEDVAAEQQRAAHPRRTQQPLQLRVALAHGAVKSDEQQIAEPRHQRGQPAGLRWHEGATAGGDRQKDDERHDASRSSGGPGAGTQGRPGRCRRGRDAPSDLQNRGVGCHDRGAAAAQPGDRPVTAWRQRRVVGRARDRPGRRRRRCA